jgi:hypothetical protein
MYKNSPHHMGIGFLMLTTAFHPPTHHILKNTTQKTNSRIEKNFVLDPIYNKYIM